MIGPQSALKLRTAAVAQAQPQRVQWNQREPDSFQRGLSLEDMLRLGLRHRRGPVPVVTMRLFQLA